MEGLKIWADGSCINNPGPMRTLIYIEKEPPEILDMQLGIGTNNIAELQAVVEALVYVKRDLYGKKRKTYELMIDSKYVKDQLDHDYKTKKNTILVQLAKKIYEEVKQKTDVNITLVRREKNKAGIMLEERIKGEKDRIKC
jgi:ribonuclease HI